MPASRSLPFLSPLAKLVNFFRRSRLGSSEVLESIIGKFKCVPGERGQHGLTGMVLSIGALVGHVTVEAVQAALAEVPNCDVWNGCQTHLGTMLHGLRRRIALALGTEQTRQPLLLGKT